MIQYRPLKKCDVEQIQKLALKSWLFTYKKIYCEKRIRKEVAEFYSDEDFRSHLAGQKAGDEIFIVALEGRKVLGYANVLKENRVWELIRIYVNPESIGQGIGTCLIKNIEDWLRKKGAKQYIAHPHTRNSLAKRFYRSRGFKRDKERDRGWNSPCYLKELS